MADNLTPKQRAFVREYQLDLNGTQAAIRAGYSARTAAVQAHRMQRKANIRAAIEEGQAAAAKKAEISREWLIEKLKKIALDDDKDRVAALRELGRLLGLYEEKVAPRGEGLQLILNMPEHRPPTGLPPGKEPLGLPVVRQPHEGLCRGGHQAKSWGTPEASCGRSGGRF